LLAAFWDDYVATNKSLLLPNLNGEEFTFQNEAFCFG
jgi:hypothetical protein